MEELLKLITEQLGENITVSDTIKDAVSSELQKQKDAIYSKDQENLKLKNTFKKLGKEPGAPYDEFIDNILDTLKNKDTKIAEDELTLNGVNSNVLNLTSKLEKALGDITVLTEEKSRAETINLDMKTREGLAKYIGGQVYGEGNLIDSVLSRNKYSIDGDNISFGEGDNKIGIKDFVSNLLEQNKDILRSPQTGGTESDSGDGKQMSTEIEDIINRL